jgi:hypothetical protein
MRNGVVGTRGSAAPAIPQALAPSPTVSHSMCRGMAGLARPRFNAAPVQLAIHRNPSLAWFRLVA